MISFLSSLNNRDINLICGVMCVSSLLIAKFYFEDYLGLEPCYLCITQRVFIAIAGLLFFIWSIHDPKRLGARIYALLVLSATSAGAYFSLKQLYLQSLPEEQVPQCGPPVDYLFETFSNFEVIAMLLRGDGNCAKIQWEFLSITMPGWVLLIFIVLTAASILNLTEIK
jgi:disulfide bond formation protein DsbB